MVEQRVITPGRLSVVVWSGWVVAALLLLPVLGGAAYTGVVAGSAAVVALLRGVSPASRGERRAADLVAIALLYITVVALMRTAFVVFTTANVLGLFLSFAAALVLGVAGPAWYTAWVRRRSLRELGLRRDNWRSTAILAVLFAGVQFGLTLWGTPLPARVDWVPLLAMSLVVGVFEAVFFRGFVQGRLEEMFGPVFGVAGAAVLYGLYHVGYGMGGDEIVFLTGLGFVYAIAYSVARNLLVLWPLLTPLGSFYANLEAGDITLPWSSIAGFADVLVVMAAALWLAERHVRRSVRSTSSPVKAAI